MRKGLPPGFCGLRDHWLPGYILQGTYLPPPPKVCSPPLLQELAQRVAIAPALSHNSKSIVVIGWEGDISDLVVS